jgi:SAM-dependent methyltransferase
MNKMIYNSKNEWLKHFKNIGISYPSEFVIRIFKGNYPKLHLNQELFKNKKICDISCGNGRNIPFLINCGFKVYGTEISKDIVDKVIMNLKKAEICKYIIKVGLNGNLPFKDEYFDFLLSWNACYYMGNQRDFGKYVKEYSRILKKDGYLILSIPKKTCFIYKESEQINREFRMIKKDPFNIRNGEVLKMFKNEMEIKKKFSSNFYNFNFASIHDDCFGYNYHWHIVVCQKK